MDVSKPGSVGFGAPILESAGPGGAGGANRFADVLSGGGQPPGAGQTEAKTPFSTPILDTEISSKVPEMSAKRKVASLDVEMRAGGHRRPTLHVIGERAGHAPGAAGVQASREPISFKAVANDTAKAESRIDAMIDAARRGKNFSPSELLGLQMEVFKYQQTVEVIGKTAEKVVGGIKQTLGTQV